MYKVKLNRTIFFALTLLLFCLLPVSNGFATEPGWSIENINQSIQKKLEFYNKTFPDIQFVHLKNGDWEKSLQALELFIGYQATNLDYEHPAELREALLYATVEKIRMMLIHGVPSSYLFKVGEMPLASRQHVCVITLNAKNNVASNRVATNYFIDLPDKVLETLPEEKYLDKEQHLDFIVDHEAFHCVDTFHYGGIPMSEKTYSTQYTCFKRESQADMFAIAMNIKRKKKISPYVNNISMIRGMTLLNGEILHNSLDAIRLITRSDISEIIASQPRDLVSRVKNTYKTIAPDYDEFVRYRIAAIATMAKLGIEPFEMADLTLAKTADKKLVKKLIKQTHDAYQQYVGKTYQPEQ